MRITESQLRLVIRQTIAEEQLNEGIKDSTILTLSAIILAAAGLAGKITNTKADVDLANQNKAIASELAPEAVKKFEDITDPASGFNFVTTIGDNTGGM